MPDFDPYHKWLGIPKKDQPPNHYRLLGLDLFEEDSDVIDAAANRVMTYLQQCATGKHVATSQKLLNEVAKARVALLNPKTKAKYDAELEAQLDRDLKRSSRDEPVQFAELPVEPDPLSFLNQQSSDIDFDAIASSSAPVVRHQPTSGGIPGWAAALGLLVALICCGAVGYRMFADRTEKTLEPEVIAEIDEAAESESQKTVRSRRSKVDSKNADSKKAEADDVGVPAVTSTKKSEDQKTSAIDKMPAPTTDTLTKNPATIVSRSFEQKELVNSLGMSFALLRKGDFSMGSPDDDSSAASDEHPRHRVLFTRSFYLSKYETTVENFNAVMPIPKSNSGGSAAKLPVTEITWLQAVEFCERLGRIENRHYRLPTEAEWEYACRGGTTSRWSCGDEDSALANHAWLQENSGDQLHEVGTLKPNAWGLFDMHGNAAEWCFDVYSAGFYGFSRLQNPIGPEGLLTATRTYRGGSWSSENVSARSAYRAAQSPKSSSRQIGFRVLLEADQFGDALASSEPAPFLSLAAQPNQMAAGNRVSITTPDPSSPQPATAVTPNSKTPPRPTNVPANAIHWEGHWYWFPPNKVTFKEALRIATFRKGRLVSISSQAENDFVKENILGPTVFGCAKLNGQWMNSLKQRQRYFNWAIGQPTNGVGENFAVIFPEGEWHDYLEDTLNFAVEWGDED